jgi:hypothetical protein
MLTFGECACAARKTPAKRTHNEIRATVFITSSLQDRRICRSRRRERRTGRAGFTQITDLLAKTIINLGEFRSEEP